MLQERNGDSRLQTEETLHTQSSKPFAGLHVACRERAVLGRVIILERRPRLIIGDYIDTHALHNDHGSATATMVATPATTHEDQNR